MNWSIQIGIVLQLSTKVVLLVFVAFCCRVVAYRYFAHFYRAVLPTCFCIVSAMLAVAVWIILIYKYSHCSFDISHQYPLF